MRCTAIENGISGALAKKATPAKPMTNATGMPITNKTTNVISNTTMSSLPPSYALPFSMAIATFFLKFFTLSVIFRMLVSVISADMTGSAMVTNE